jgi:hypothetical protein
MILKGDETDKGSQHREAKEGRWGNTYSYRTRVKTVQGFSREGA